MNILKIIALTLVLQGCSSLGGIVDAVNPMKEEKGIEVSAQIGKENTQIQTKKKALVQVESETKTENITSNDNKAETINQETVTNNPTPVWLILAFAAMSGIAIPNPFNTFSNKRKRRDRDSAKKQMQDEIKYLRKELSNVTEKINKA